MDRSFLTSLHLRPQIVALMIGVITLVVLFLNGFGLAIGVTNVLPHLFYIPIILVAYYFPRRGIPFSVVVSAIYCGMVYYFHPVLSDELFSAGGRVIIFILIAVVVSVLTTRMRESETLFRGVAERSSDIILLASQEGVVTYVSPSVKRLLGYDPYEIEGTLPGTFIHPGDLGLLMETIRVCSGGKAAEVITIRFRKKDGEYVFIEFFGTPVMKAGAVSGFQVIGRDITERKRAEESQVETSRRLAEIIDFLPDPTMVIDRAGIVVAWNRAMEVMSGILAPAVLGRGRESYTGWIAGHDGPLLIDYVMRQDPEGIRAAYPNAHFEGPTVKTEVDITRTDGTRFSLWISATPLIDPEGEVTGAIESLRDVTGQKKVQRALRESNAYLDAVINTMADPLFIKDRMHRFVKLNNGFCQFSGHPRGELLGKSDYDFFKPEEADIFWEKDEEVFRTGRENENEESITDASGTTHTISTKKTLYTNSAGEEFIVGIIRDITERKKTEQALRQANRKLNLLSGITRHDINNQLLVLSGYLEISKESLGDPARTGEFIAKEERIAETIAHQIRFTKDYEDLGIRAPVWQNVAAVITRVIARLPMRTIRVDTGNPDLDVFADPLLEKVFYNLIDNALRYGGEQMSAVRVTDREENGVLVISVEDNGTGISAEDKTKLFTRGFGQHTGLGLYLSREILAITGITITETGIPGRGARFEIAVPAGAWRSAGA